MKKVSVSCSVVSSPMDCNPRGFSVHRILQARILEWVAILFSRGSSRPRDWTQVSCIAGRVVTVWAIKGREWKGAAGKARAGCCHPSGAVGGGCHSWLKEVSEEFPGSLLQWSVVKWLRLFSPNPVTNFWRPYFLLEELNRTSLTVGGSCPYLSLHRGWRNPQLPLSAFVLF